VGVESFPATYHFPPAKLCCSQNFKTAKLCVIFYKKMPKACKSNQSSQNIVEKRGNCSRKKSTRGKDITSSNK
jgi:hypothetical protein